MEDRFTGGFTAGVVAGIAMNLLDYFSFYVVHFTRARYLDFGGILIFGYLPVTLREVVFAQLIQIVFTGLLGVIFAYFITLVTSMNYLFKGWFYGIITWFVIYSVGILFKVPLFVKVPFETAFSNFIGASVYGLVLAEMTRLLQPETRPAE